MLSPITRRNRKCKVRVCDALSKETDELMVWWYGGIVKNYKAETVPWVIVFFRKLDEKGNLGLTVSRKIAITFLGLLRIGTIWKNGESKSEAVISVDKTKHYVDFTEGAWKFVSPVQAAKSGTENPINQDDYPLPFSYDKNWLIDFPLANGKNLLIPCTEFFVRYYGRSEEVTRVLATYGWDEINKHFYAPFDQPVIPDSWPIKLKKRMHNGDVVFLAHMKYDLYTALASKSINSQIENSYLNKEPCAFVKVGTWFEGKAEVLVSGLWINQGRTFLALRILGGSDPQQAPIQRDRENSNKIDGVAGAVLRNETDGRPARVLNKLQEIIDLTGDQEPDHGAASVEVEEPDFVVLGDRRVVVDVRRNKSTNNPCKPRDLGEVKEFSSGEPHGGGKEVGFSSIHAPAHMETEGMLLDMWNAMLELKKKNPMKINSVEWFTFETGFSSASEPKMVRLKPFDKNQKIATKIRSWPYYDVYNKILRGILVARLVVAGISVYFIEIERRPRTKRGGDGNLVDIEEPFMGFVIVLDDQSQFESWLDNFLSRVRDVRGIVQKLVDTNLGNAAAFKHSTAKGDGVLCETAVLNALKKVGIAHP